MSVALFPQCAAAILENKSNALGIIQRSFENTDPNKIVHGVLLDKCGIRTIKNPNFSLWSKSLYMKTLTILMLETYCHGL